MRRTGTLLLACCALSLAVGSAAAETGRSPRRTNRTASSLFCSYKPNYFVLGDPTSRFQLSVRYRVWVFGDSAGSCGSASTPHQLEFAYTQKSIWRVFESSSPFEETNYNPELYYRYNLPDPGILRALRVGLEHESNGEGGDESSSWDRIYLEASIDALPGNGREDWRVRIYPKVWFILPNSLSGDDEEIRESLGYGSLTVAARTPRTRFGDGELEVSVSKGADWSDPSRGNVLLGASWGFWNARSRQDSWWGFTPDLYVQYFIGYAETLAAADEYREALRIGFRLLR